MPEQIIIEFVGDVSKLTPAVDAVSKISPELGKTVDQMKKLSTESDKSVSKITANAQKTVKSFSDVEKKVSDVVEILTDEFMKGAVDALEEAGVSVEEFSDAMTNAQDKAEKSSKSLKGQLRQLKEEISRMDDAGESGSQRFTEMSVEAAKLEDQLGDTAARVRALASDTANIDAAVQGIQVIAAGYQLAAGAQELFGDGSEDIQKALVKLNAIMAITSSIQQIQNALQKETILYQKASIIWSNAQAFAQRVYAFSVGSATGALKLFRIAMLATGIGAVIALLLLAADAMGVFGDSTDETTASIEDQTAAADELINSLQEIIDTSKKMRAAQAGGTDELNRQLEILKARGATAEEVFKKEQQIRQRELSELKVAADSYLNLYNQRKKNGDLTAVDAEKLTAKINDINKQGLDKTNEIEAAKLEFNKKMQDEATKKAKDAADKRLEIAKKNAEALYEIEKRRIEREVALSKAVSESGDSDLNVRLAAMQQYQKASLELTELNRGKELAAEKLTAIQVQNINDKYNQERLLKLNQFGIDRLTIIRTNNDRIEEENRRNIERLNADDEAAQNTPVNSVNNLFQQIQRNNEQSQAAALANAEKRYKDGAISLENYEAERARIIAAGTQAELSNEVKRIEAIVAIRRSQGQDVSELENQLRDAQEALRQADLASYKQAEDEKTEATKKRIELVKQIEQASLEVIGEAVSSIFDTQKSQRDAALQNSLDLLNQQREKELANKNLTEQQKEEIQKRYDQRQKTLKKQAAEREKQAQISQAIINGLLAITKTFASYGFTPAGIIAAAAQAATTLITVNKIRQTQIPGFKKGTKKAPKGFAWVGEEGPELMELAGGEKIYKYSDSMKVDQAWRGGRRATPEEILALSTTTPSVGRHIISNSYVSQTGGLHIDYDKLGEVIAERFGEMIPEPVVNQFSFDKNGFNYALNEAGSRRTYLNNRYSFKK